MFILVKLIFISFIIEFLNRDNEVIRKWMLALFIASKLPSFSLYAQDNANIPANKVDLVKNKPKESITLIWKHVSISSRLTYLNKQPFKYIEYIANPNFLAFDCL